MYTEKTRIARHIGRKTRNAVITFRGPRMDRHGIRAAVGAMTPLIATLLLCPSLDCRGDRSVLHRGVPHGFADTGAQRREGSP